MIYLDNAATSHPKPDCVYDAVEHALKRVGASPGRGAHRAAREASEILDSARRLVSEFFDMGDPRRVIFTRNATESINVVLKGHVRPGDRVIISHMEHNSVTRPLHRLMGQGVEVEILPCNPWELISPADLEDALKKPARLVVMTHACNVNGALLPLAPVASLCREKRVPLFLDAAQTAGIQDISVRQLGLGMLACSGHKGLLGPAGVGVLYIREDLQVDPLLEGGTGSQSENWAQPEFCPDRYESGTPNLPGIAGLAAGLRYLLDAGVERVAGHELRLAAQLEEGLKRLPGVRVLSPKLRGTGVVSFTVADLDPAHVGFLLDEGYGIAVRTGLHCAPLAHQCLGTYPEGTVRVSPGFSNTADEMEYFLGSLAAILSHR